MNRKLLSICWGSMVRLPQVCPLPSSSNADSTCQLGLTQKLEKATFNSQSSMAYTMSLCSQQFESCFLLPFSSVPWSPPKKKCFSCCRNPSHIGNTYHLSIPNWWASPKSPNTGRSPNFLPFTIFWYILQYHHEYPMVDCRVSMIFPFLGEKWPKKAAPGTGPSTFAFAAFPKGFHGLQKIQAVPGSKAQHVGPVIGAIAWVPWLWRFEDLLENIGRNQDNIGINPVKWGKHHRIIGRYALS